MENTPPIHPTIQPVERLAVADARPTTTTTTTTRAAEVIADSGRAPALTTTRTSLTRRADSLRIYQSPRQIKWLEESMHIAGNGQRVFFPATRSTEEANHENSKTKWLEESMHIAGNGQRVFFPATRSTEEANHENSKTNLSINLQSCGASVTFISPSQNFIPFSPKPCDLNPNIFGCDVIESYQEAVNSAFLNPNQVHLFMSADAAHNGGTAPNTFKIPVGKATEYTDGMDLHLSAHPQILEAINTNLAHGGFNGLLYALPNCKLTSSGYLQPTPANEASIRDELAESLDQIEYPIISISSNTTAIDCSENSHVVEIMLASAPNYTHCSIESQSTNACLIQKYCAESAYLAMFARVLELAQNNPEKLIVCHTTGLGIVLLGNNETFIARAFKRAAKMFQAKLFEINTEREENGKAPLKIRIQFDIKKETINNRLSFTAPKNQALFKFARDSLELKFFPKIATPTERHLVDIKEFIDNMLELNITRENAVIINIDNSSFVIWCDQSLKKIYTQRREFFLTKGATNRLTLYMHNDSVHFLWEDTKTEVPELFFNSVLLNILSESRNVFAKRNALVQATTQFNPRCLVILNKYFQGSKFNIKDIHFRPRTEHTLAVTDSNQKETLLVWMRTKEEFDLVLARTVTKRYINCQLFRSFTTGDQKDKLGICLDNSGNILSVQVDNKDCDPQKIFSSKSIWNSRLSAVLHHILTNYALTVQPLAIQIHPMVLAKAPEDVLLRCCATNTFNFGRVHFFTDDLTTSPGIDAGGLARQFLADLCRNLFDGHSSRKIRMNNDCPIITDIKSAIDCKIFSCIGQLLTCCYTEDSKIMGRIFTDKFFSLLQILFEYKGNITENESLLLRCIDTTISEEARPLLQIFQPSIQLPLPDNLIPYLDALDLDVDLNSLSIKDIQQKVFEFLKETYLLTIQSAHIISFSIPKNTQEAMLRMTSEELSTQIQGPAFCPEAICTAIKYDSDNPIILQKIIWLKKFIRAKGQAWGESFLFSVSGRRNLKSSDRIIINHSADQFCRSHACFFTLEIPTIHTTVGSPQTTTQQTEEELFFNNLALTLGETEFDAR